MFCSIDNSVIIRSEEPFDSKFIDLVNSDNTKEALSYIKSRPLNKLIDSYGNHLLHVAARFNNVNIINLLIDSGCDLTVKDPSGMTPLMIAVIHKNFEIAKILHAAYLDTTSQLKLELSLPDDRSSWEIPILKNLVLILKEQGIKSEKIGQALGKINAAPSSVINFHNPVITKAYLQSIPQINHYTNFLNIFREIGAKFDSQHIIVILQNAPYDRNRLYTNFGGYLKYYIGKCHGCESSEQFLKEILSLTVFNREKLLDYLEEALQKAEKSFIKIFLQYDFHSIVKVKYGRDVLACLFGNKDTKVVQLLREDQIDVRDRGLNEQTALHFAVRRNSIENIKMLLELGSDPNAIDSYQHTPFSSALFNPHRDDRYIKLLLQAGADPLIGRSRYFFEEINIPDKKQVYVKVDWDIIAQLAIYYSLNRYKKEFERLVTDRELKEFFTSCQKQLIELKTNKIRENGDEMLNMYVIMTELPKKLARYVNEEDLYNIVLFLHSDYGKNLIPYYRYLLIKRAKEIFERKKAIPIICQIIGIPDSNHLVIEKIYNYLKIRDLRKLLKINENQEMKLFVNKDEKYSFKVTPNMWKFIAVTFFAACLFKLRRWL